MTRPSASSTNELPSKTSSSWPPTALQKTRAQPVVPRPRREHLLALRVLADVEGRGGEVDEHVRARPRALDGGWARLPQVLAHCQAERRSPELEQADLGARLEVALLVEHAVVRQQPLAVDVGHAAVRADEARVVEAAVLGVRRTDERDDARGRLRHLTCRLRSRTDERGAEQEVLRRIAGDRELREHNEVGAGDARLSDPRDDAVTVAVEVADGRVDLSQGDLHSFRLTV